LDAYGTWYRGLEDVHKRRKSVLLSYTYYLRLSRIAFGDRLAYLNMI